MFGAVIFPPLLFVLNYETRYMDKYDDEDHNNRLMPRRKLELLYSRERGSRYV